MAVVFFLLAHGIAKHILRKTRAECVKQIVLFCSFWPLFLNTEKLAKSR